MVAEKEKVKEETARLRQELQDLQHDIANDTLNFPSDDEEDEFFGGLAQGDGSVPGDESVLGYNHAPRGSLSIEDSSHGEQT
ncbi:hypothetical protein AAG906_034304 [Vitis piasezkii]